MFNNVRADIRRHMCGNNRGVRGTVSALLSQGLQAIIVYRFFSWCKKWHIPTQPVKFFVERFIEITTGISIPANCRIAKGLRIHHFGGIILHPSVKIGENCTLYHGVTIGDRGEWGNAASIGNNTLIGAGAKIIGEITIGNNCRIGANAVVHKNVPENSIVFGNPCIIKPMGINNAECEFETENTYNGASRDL